MKKHPGLVEVDTAVLFFGFAGLFGKFLALSLAIIVVGRTFFAALVLFISLSWFKQRLSIDAPS